jgi:hypothetical protein
VQITELSFETRNEGDVERDNPSATLSWVVRGTSVDRTGTSEITMGFEPYGGELIDFSRDRVR